MIPDNSERDGVEDECGNMPLHTTVNGAPFPGDCDVEGPVSVSEIEETDDVMVDFAMYPRL